MKGLLLYFSGTGNTKFIAEKIQDDFMKQNYTLHKKSIEDTKVIYIDNYDFLILGYPIYCMYPPIFFINYVKNNIPPCKEEKQVILFANMAANTKSDFKELEKILNEKNYKVVLTKTFQMPNNYVLDGKYKLTKEHLIEGILNNTINDVHSLVKDFINKNYKKENMMWPMGKFFKILSISSTKYMNNTVKNFSVNETCTKCMKCKNNCPRKNISFIDNKIVFNNNCILCTRCINGCPVNAILYKGIKRDQYKIIINRKL